MRIAVFLESIHLQSLNPDIRHVFLFELDDMLVTALGEEILSEGNADYIVLWLLVKQVERIYIRELEEATGRWIEKAGIEIHPLEEIRENPFLRSLLIEKG